MENSSKVSDCRSKFSPSSQNSESCLQLAHEKNCNLPDSFSLSFENVKREIKRKEDNISFLRKKFFGMDPKLNEAQSKLKNIESELINAMLSKIQHVQPPQNEDSNQTKFSELNRCIPKNDGSRNKESSSAEKHNSSYSKIEKTTEIDKKNKETQEKITESAQKWQMIFKKKKGNEIECNKKSENRNKTREKVEVKEKIRCRLKEFENGENGRIRDKQENYSRNKTLHENRERKKKISHHSEETTNDRNISSEERNCYKSTSRESRREKESTKSYQKIYSINHRKEDEDFLTRRNQKSRKRSRDRKDSKSRLKHKKMKKEVTQDAASLKPATPKLSKDVLESPASPDGSYDDAMIMTSGKNTIDRKNNDTLEERIKNSKKVEKNGKCELGWTPEIHMKETQDALVAKEFNILQMNVDKSEEVEEKMETVLEEVNPKMMDEVSEMELYVAQNELQKLLSNMNSLKDSTFYYESVNEIEEDLISDDEELKNHQENNLMSARLQNEEEKENLVLELSQVENVMSHEEENLTVELHQGEENLVLELPQEKENLVSQEGKNSVSNLSQKEEYSSSELSQEEENSASREQENSASVPQQEENLVSNFAEEEKKEKPTLHFTPEEKEEKPLAHEIRHAEKMASENKEVEDKPKENMEAEKKLKSKKFSPKKKNLETKENVTKKGSTAVFVKRRRRKIVLGDYTTSYSIQ